MKYLTVLLIMSWLGYSYACSCIPQTDTEIYCSNQTDFGVLVEVKKSGSTFQGMKRYRINLITTYESNTEEGQTVQENFMYTSLTSCGVFLVKNKFYFISGKYIDITNNRKGMKTELCLDLQKEFASQPTYTPPSCSGQ
ncbi:uncharacterized protein LOC123537208 [Mercenaria mercenaria]|uniref:uncharacterized protein LOC123537208 n=1 Tax=Mercenaria mercenaria TaxID=6596 RepID=UPI00234F4E1F|nr:uncharacterized protein LOC123537208 [Mercenaria mercenaria]